MSHRCLSVRVLFTAIVVAALLASGCSWFRRDDSAYKKAIENQPLEVPPPLDAPVADPAMQIPGDAGTATAPPAQTAQAAATEQPAETQAAASATTLPPAQPTEAPATTLPPAQPTEAQAAVPVAATAPAEVAGVPAALPTTTAPPAEPTETAAAAPSSSVYASSASSAASAAELTVTGGQGDVWARLGEVLGTVEGANIVSRAQLIGTYEVQYQGQTFLLRTQAQGESTRITATGPDGQVSSTHPAAAALIGQLQQRLN